MITSQHAQLQKEREKEAALQCGLARDEESFRETKEALRKGQLEMDAEIHQQLKHYQSISNQKHDSQVYYDRKEHLERQVLLTNQAIYLGNDKIIQLFTLLETNNQALKNYFTQKNLRKKVIMARNKDFERRDAHEEACQRFLEFELQQNLDFENAVLVYTLFIIYLARTPRGEECQGHGEDAGGGE